MPRPGGEADKLGNQYEALWTVEQLLDVATGSLTAITVEAHGSEAEGVEFHVETPRGIVRYHSVKRQKQGGDWSIADLTAADKSTNRSILGDLFAKLNTNNHAEICFVSATGANALRELSERAQHADDLATFHASLSQALLKAFEDICDRLGITEQSAFDKLVLLEVATKTPTLQQRDVERRTQDLFYQKHGGPGGAVDVRLRLAEFVLRELGKRIDRPQLMRWLQDNNIGLRDWSVDKPIRELVDRQNARYLSSATSDLINSAQIDRCEADNLLEALKSPNARGALLVAAGGYGKSCVLAQVTSRLEQAGTPFLCLRMDAIQPCTTSAQIGEQIGFTASPASVLAGIADAGSSVLIVDQLDALSTVSGRRPELWHAFQELCDDAAAYSRMQIIVACREFDLEHDHRLRPLGQKESDLAVVKLDLLQEEDVEESLNRAGRSRASLSDEEFQLLRVPIHLLLFLESQSADSFGSVGALFDGYWRRKRQAVRDRLGREPSWNEVIDNLSERMSRDQTLQAPKAALGNWESDADAMASEGVLFLSDGYYRFFHETFFDYAYARRLCAKSISLVDFLTSTEQYLFRRAQTRQILTFRRENDRPQYIRDLSEVLGSDKVRFHIRRMVASWLKTIDAPKADEWFVVSPYLLEGELSGSVSNALRSHVGWFDLLCSEGVFEAWLGSGNDKLINAALWYLEDFHLHDTRSAEIAGLLAPYCEAEGDWPQRLIRVLSWGIAHKSDAMGQIHLALIAQRAYDEYKRDGSNGGFWELNYHAAEENPRFLIDVLAAWYDRAVSQFDDRASCIFDGCSNNSSRIGAQLVGKAAELEPRYFVEIMLPRVVRTVRDTEVQGPDGVESRAWRYLSNDADPHDIDDAILFYLMRIMGTLARDDPQFFRQQSSTCTDFSHLPISYVLLNAWCENPEEFAEDCISYLIADRSRLDTGYAIVVGNSGNSACAITRRCLKALTTHCSVEHLRLLEDTIIGYTNDYERRTPSCRGSDELLLLRSINQSRQSRKVQLRIEELERKFPNLSDSIAVEDASGASFTTICSPIPDEKAELMSDAQWISAMEKYNKRSEPMRGGAVELSRALREFARKERDRFASLTAEMPETLHPDYFSAILDGLSSRWSELTEQEKKIDKADRDSLATDDFLAVIERLHALPGRPCGSSIVAAIGELADRQLPNCLFEILDFYARFDPDPEADRSDDLYTQGLNCTRGQAACSVASILFEDQDRYLQLETTIDVLIRDDVLAVRVCAIRLLCAMLNFARDQAVAKFVFCVTDAPPVWGTVPFVRFLHYAVRSHYFELRDVMLTALKDGSEDAVKNSAQQIALAELSAFGDDLAVGDLDLVLQAGESARVAAAGVYAHNLKDATVGDRAAERLRRLFNDESGEVREAVSRAFFDLDGDRLLELEELIAAYVESPSFETGSRSLLHALIESCAKLPNIICRAGERAVELCGVEVTHIAYDGALYARDLSALIVRQYEQTTDSEMKKRCLDIIDKMERIGFYGLDDELRKIDR